MLLLALFPFFSRFLFLVFVFHAHNFSGYRADLYFIDSALRVADIKGVDQLAMFASSSPLSTVPGARFNAISCACSFVILACLASFASLLASSCPRAPEELATAKKPAPEGLR